MTQRHTTHNYAPSKVPTRQLGAAPTPSGLSPVSSSWSSSAIGLPDVLQSYAQNRRSGTLVIYLHQRPHFLGLRNGNIVFLTGNPDGSLLRAMVWTQHLSPQRAQELAAALPTADAAAAREMLDDEIVDVQAVKDALACLVQETFHEAFLVQMPEWDLAPEEPDDDWARVQENIGLSIGIAGLLMELMRSRDEYQSLECPLSDPCDVPIPLRGDACPEDSAQSTIYALCDGHHAAWQVVTDSWLIPSVGRLALAELFADAWLRLASGQEIVALADHYRDNGAQQMAIGLYRRALAMGLEHPRAQFDVAVLLAQDGEHSEAAQAFMVAAAQLETSTPDQAIVAYQHACELGHEQRHCLQRIAVLNHQRGDNAAARDALWALVDVLEEEGEFADALRACNDLNRLDTDRIRVLSRQGDLAQRAGDYQKALLAWDQLQNLLLDCEDEETIARVNSRILAIDPGRCATALQHAKHLQSVADNASAAEVIRAALAAAGSQIDHDLAIACHELLAEVDANDAENRRWLARSYRDREDRKGALSQLSILLRTHEETGNHQGLLDTLRELVDLDPLQVDSVRRLADLYGEQGRMDAAVDVWRRAMDAALAKGDAHLALQFGDEAATHYPLAVPLRLLLVKSANRHGDTEIAVEHCLAAARLARLSGKKSLARQCLQQVLPVVSEQLPVHAELLELLSDAPAKEQAAALANASEGALKSGNFGLALRWAQQWQEAATDGDLQPRQRLLEAYLRLGDHLQAQATCETLADDMVAANRRQEACRLLSSMVERYPRSPNLLTMLARVQRELRLKREAVQTLQRLIALLQQESRNKEAKALLIELEHLSGDADLAQRIRGQLERGEVVQV
ncbi:MAG: DUF4388 domain-containing protein [Planctomycetota bacterium]|nr:MAG: DUF4388 domain-containing protein [Planctomycetota bacterium]